jgi:hypothetical protein
MPRKKQTPPHIAELLARHDAQLDWVDEILATKARVPVENQAEHVKRPVEYWEGFAYGANSTVENLLMAYGCYRGFTYVGPKVTLDGKSYNPGVGLAHPDYKEWRRCYHRT